MAQNLQQTLTDFTNRLNAQNRFSAEYVAEVNKCLNEILELLQNLVQRYNDCQKRLLESSQQFERDSISSEGSSDTQKTADASDAVDDAIEKIDEVKRNPNPDDDVLNDLRNTLIGTQRRLMDAVAEINELRQQLAQQQQIIATTFANLNGILNNFRPNTADLQELQRLCAQLRAELAKATGATVEPQSGPPVTPSRTTATSFLSSLLSPFESKENEETEETPVVNLSDVYNQPIRRVNRAAVAPTGNPLLSSITPTGAPPGASTFTPRRLPPSTYRPDWDSSKTPIKKLGGTKKSNKTYKKNRKHKRGGFTYKLKPPSRNHSKTHKKRYQE
jgi:uncharacterized membrane-anchored protein YhcB (DUF1043 family)